VHWFNRWEVWAKVLEEKIGQEEEEKKEEEEEE
jgi:hypothetical protein